MDDYTAVTTFSPGGYAVYGRRFVESFLQYWPLPLIVYYETERPAISHPRLILRDLDQDADRARFLARYDRPEYRGTPDDYATQAIRFSHKVFALTGLRQSATWCLWLDADVETFAPVTPQFLRSVCPDGYALSYLGRQSMMPETGFLAWRFNDPTVRAMMTRLRELYTSGALFDLDVRERHDGASFDRVRAMVPVERQNNLSKEVSGTHVWPHTVLGTVMRHWKGQARKREAYGRTLA